MKTKLFLILFLVFGIAGCSHIYGDQGVIKNHDSDYLKAQTAPPLKMPPGYSSSNIQTHYATPQTGYGAPDKRVVLTPPELNATSNNNSAGQ